MPFCTISVSCTLDNLHNEQHGGVTCQTTAPPDFRLSDEGAATTQLLSLLNQRQQRGLRQAGNRLLFTNKHTPRGSNVHNSSSSNSRSKAAGDRVSPSSGAQPHGTPSSSGSSTTAASPSPTPAAAAAAESPWVPALFLGDVFITANTVAGIINSSAAAAAEGRLPTARAARAQRDAAHQQQQQQQQQAAGSTPWPAAPPLDPASSLLLQLLQPLPQRAAHEDHPGGSSSSSSSRGSQGSQRTQRPASDHQQQQQQPRVFYVQHDSAELVRQELLLHRYQELVAARAAAGLPTTPAAGSSDRQQQQQQPKQHRLNMVQAIQAGVGKLTGSSTSGSSGGGGRSTVLPSGSQETPAAKQQQQQQQAPSNPLSPLTTAVGRWLPPWMQQQQQQQGQQQPAKPPAAVPGTSSNSSGGAEHTVAAVPAATGAPAGGHSLAAPDLHAPPPSSSSSSSVVGARHGLPAVLAAQLQGFMTDLQHLEEDAVLREGAALIQQRQQQQEQHGSSSSSSRGRKAAKGTDRGQGHKQDGEHGQQQQQSLPFNFASYVARLPLGVAMQLLQQQQQQQQQVDGQATKPPPQRQRQSLPQPQLGDFKLAISGSDLTACLAVRGKSAFVDFDGVGEGPGFHLGLWGSDDEDSGSSSEDDPQQQQQQVVGVADSAVAEAPAAATAAAAAAAATAAATTAGAAAVAGAAGDISRELLEWDHGGAAYTPLALPKTGYSSSSGSSSNSSRARRGRQHGVKSSSSNGSSSVPVTLNALQAAAADMAEDAEGEVVVEFKQPDTGFCDRTPVFQVPGLDVVLDTSYGEVCFVPAFMSLSHLSSFLAAARTVATRVWLAQRRAGRKQWQQRVQMTALQMAGFSGGGSAAATAAEEESDDDGMGEPPEAKAILEELGEANQGSSRGLPNRAGGLGGIARVPNTKGLAGFMNALSLGVVSLATEAVCGVQEARDRLAVAFPAFGDWVHGIPSNINIKGLLLEDLTAAAAAHNAGKLQPPSQAAALRCNSSPGQQQQQDSSASAPAGAAASPSSSLVDPLGLAGSTLRSSSSSSSSQVTSQQQQQQQQLMLPPLSAPCLDGLRLLLSAGWMVASDVLANDGRMVELILQQPSGGLRDANIQFNEEGEVALRLALQVVGAPHLPIQPLQLPTTRSNTTQQQQQQYGRRLVGRGSSDAGRQQQVHAFELGVHLNLTQLVGLPSTRHADKLSAERAGFGKAARGVLLIGDLGLNPDDLAVLPWRPPPLGIGVLPAPQQTHQAAAAVAVPDAAAAVAVAGDAGSTAVQLKGSSSSSRRRRDGNS